ncbi:glycosyltransferase family 4 protein [Chryseobacterium daeguense]|uniref:glycosyltransferase family 4 protein n=1 Tax=Chryseobacterium daeguense TaxID=412438 RepID=UPI0003F8271E|nr:glycosyltransferase family 4 protein [Chryseobacterium daeguense]
MMKKIAIVTNVIPSYREGFYDKILADRDIQVTIYCQSNIPNTKLKTIHQKYPDNVVVVKFIDFFNEKANIQLLPFFKILNKYDTVFIDGNPRYISHYVLANIFKLFKPNKVVLWSMIHSYKANSFTENIRLNWTKKFKRVFAYNDKEAGVFKKEGFKGVCIGMNNGLDQEKIERIITKWSTEKLQIWQKEKCIDNEIIISCTRLIQKNELDKLLIRFQKILEIKTEIKWYIIGDGDQRQDLERIVHEKRLENNVFFLGEIYDEEKLAPWFLTASLMVHPAAIGLSILHAFGYGLPVITHDDERYHGPEFSALINEHNSLTYQKDNYDDLIEKVIFSVNNKSFVKEIGKNARITVQKTFNVSKMAERFKIISQTPV